MSEELLYLGLLSQLHGDRIHLQYELCLARDLVCKKYPDMSQQEIQETFEELALCVKYNLTLPQNNFAKFAVQYKKEK